MTEERGDEHADAIVVGGGTAGAVIAARLVESGRSVILLEAGPDYGPLDGGAWPDDLLDAASLPTSHDWGYAGTGAAGQPLLFDRARVIGGCSSHNGCTQSAGWAGDWDTISRDAGAGWSASAMAPFFAAASERMQLREYATDEIQPFHAAFLEACVAAGLPRRDDLVDLDGGVGAGVAPVNTRGTVRINTAGAYLDAVRDDPLLAIRPGALVDRVVFVGSRATGVEYLLGTERRTVHAGLVVLSAGAYGSPEVLLRSGVGPVEELAELGVAVVRDHPAVGANLHDHPTVQLEFAGTAALAEALRDFGRTRWLPEEQAMAKLRSPFADGPFDLHVYPWVEPDDSVESGWRVILPVSQLRPRSRGAVRLQSSDPSVPAAIDPRFFSDEEDADLRSVEHGIRWVNDELRHGPLAPYLGDPIGTDAGKLDGEELRDWMRRSHTHYWHPAGSLRMGRADDPAAVVDGSARVIGLNGLYVADASIFPDIPRATPALPTVAVAERIAAFLVGDPVA
ncbi:GMC family oxidoreductase [Microbacterium saperdae]